MNKVKIITVYTALITILVTGGNIIAEDPEWQFLRANAFSKAQSENKKIIFFAGRPQCSICSYVINNVLVSSDPPVSDIIKQHYVLWYSHVDTSTEWYPYASGLGSFTLPLICIIDPSGQKIYEDRSTGPQYAAAFYNRLLHHIPDSAPPNEEDLTSCMLILRVLSALNTEPAYPDIEGDNRIGMEKAISSLQKAAGLRE